MLELKRGDILTADTEALVNTVNCIGIMGRGIALRFRKAYPENFDSYVAACKRGEVQPGRMFVFETDVLTRPRYIINFPTKRHWRGKSRMRDIESGLEALVAEVRRLGIRSIAIPPLGCGLGGLEWSEVRVRIERAMASLPDVRTVAFEPSGAGRAYGTVKVCNVPMMTPGRASLVGLMHRYLAGLMDPFVSLLEVHKLMYFLQEAGEPIRLRYVKALYGPYAENLRQVLIAIDGYLVSGYADGGDDPHKEITLLPGAVTDADAFLASHPATRGRFDRVADLVEGFETPFGLELLSTVHWVATRDGATTVEAAEKCTYEWNDRKRRFSPGQIHKAWHVLHSKGFIKSS